MKILSVIPSINPKAGGPIQGIRNYQSELVKLGCTRDIVTFEDAKDVINWDFPATLKIHSLGKAVSPLSYNLGLFAFLKKNLANYDVVIIHGLWLYHSIGTIKAFKWLQKNKPYLKLPQVYCMPHGMLDPWFQNEKTRKIKAIRNYIYWHLLEKHVVNQVDGILFTCEQELLLARTTFSGYYPKKEINVGYGIEAPPINNLTFTVAFENLCPSLKGEHFLLFLSRIDFKKGVDLLINSYIQLSQENPHLPHLVIAGPNQSVFAQEMMQLAAVNPKIHFPGMLQGEAKWGALYNCEAYLLPSHQENFGIAIVEAMACKKAVMISKHINIWKEIEAGKGGWILEKLSQEAIEDQLSVIVALSDEALHIKGDQAFETYHNKFDVKQCATIFLNALKDL